MIQVSSLSLATFFRTEGRAWVAADSQSHRFGNRYRITYEKTEFRRGYVAHYYEEGSWLCRQLSRYEPLVGIARARGRAGKPEPRYEDEPEHPFYGRKRQKLREYEIEYGIPIPKEVVDKSNNKSRSLERDRFPFGLMDVESSFLAPDISRKSLLKAIYNWRYNNRMFLFMEDIEDGEFKMIKYKFVVSEVYENEEFLGSRVWLARKTLKA